MKMTCFNISGELMWCPLEKINDVQKDNPITKKNKLKQNNSEVPNNR